VIKDKRLTQALDAAGIDMWENDLDSGLIRKPASRTLAELGYTEAEAGESIKQVLAIIHPDDIAGVQAAIDDHLRGRTDLYQSEFRLRTKGGDWIWHANFGRITQEDTSFGNRCMIGSTINVHDRKQHEYQLRQLERRVRLQEERLNEVQALLLATPSGSLRQQSSRQVLLTQVCQTFAPSTSLLPGQGKDAGNEPAELPSRTWGADGESTQALSSMPPCSQRELEILRLLGQGLGNKQMADQLGISSRTIETYCIRLAGKLGLSGMRALRHFAIRHHIQNKWA
jgi:PAS domain S-box-containing protein